MVKINVEEFDRLVTSAEHPRVEDYSRIIERLVTVTEAQAGVFWNCDQRPFVAIAHHTIGRTAKVGFSQSDHERILTQVFQQQRSALLNTKALHSAEPLTLFLAPVRGASQRVVELIFAGDHRIRSSRDFRQELGSVCDLLGKLQPPAAANVATELQDQLTPGDQSHALKNVSMLSIEAFSRYSQAIHQSIDLRLACANVANESRRLIDCDRVSVVLWHRGRFRIFAISGQPSVNRRSNTVQLLEKLAAEVLIAKTELWYPSDAALVPQIKTILDQYLVISTTRSLVIQPIPVHAPTRVEDPDGPPAPADAIIGGIVYEHNREAWLPQEMAAALQLTTQAGGTALRNASQHRNLFLYPVWKWLGKSKILKAPALLPKSLLVLSIVTALGLLLTFWPVSFYVSASGTLLPQHRRLIFPKTTGEVVTVAVEHGQAVNPGDTLALLRSEDLQLRLEDVQGRLETLKQRRSALERNKFKNATAQNAASGSIDDNLGSLQAEIDSLQRQAAGLVRIQEELRIVSPVKGQVITWDIAQKLPGRTVTPQNVIMEIADIDGPWQLELELEDRHIEHLQRGLASSSNGKLRVQFTLAADPSQTYEGTLTQVAESIQVNRDNLQVLRVKVDIDEDAVGMKQAKTGVSAKIFTGEQTSLGNLWLHEIPRTLNRYVFFYFVR